jgi:hypothetical protein
LFLYNAFSFWFSAFAIPTASASFSLFYHARRKEKRAGFFPPSLTVFNVFHYICDLAVENFTKNVYGVSADALIPL